MELKTIFTNYVEFAHAAMPDSLKTLALVGVIHLLAVMSPGPDFLLVSQHALAGSRRVALAAAAGVTCGLMVHLSWVFTGLSQLATMAPACVQILKMLGGAYLCFLGFQSLRSAFRATRGRDSNYCPVAVEIVVSNWKQAFVQGVATNAMNPKAVLYFMSFGAQFVTADVGSGLRLAISAEMALIGMLWFAAVAYVLSIPAMRHWYRNAVPWIDGALGSLFLLFAARIMTTV